MAYSRYTVSNFQLSSDKRNKNKYCWSIRGNIFISGKHTNIMASMIEEESWGSHNHQLYHYIDYTFRTRIMKNQMKVYNYQNGAKIAVFHTGLITRNSKKPLYLLSKPNNHAKKTPYWAVSQENMKDTSQWFMTKEELIKNYGIRERDLPKKLEYLPKYGKEFNKKYWCNFNWYNIFSYHISSRAKKTIVDVIRKNGCDIETKHIKHVLSDAFTNAVKDTLKKTKYSKQFVVPGLFMDFDNQEYWVNLMMHVNVFYQNKEHTFVIVMDKGYYNEYEFRDVLSLKQGYFNGRYIQRLPNFWKPVSKIIKESPKIAPIKAKIEKKEELNMPDIGDITPASSNGSNDSKISYLSNVSNNSTVLSVEPTPFSLNIDDENKIDNNINIQKDSFFNEMIQIVTSNVFKINPFTGVSECATVTKFTDKTANSVTETITFASNEYICNTYSLKNNKLVFSNKGNINQFNNNSMVLQ